MNQYEDAADAARMVALAMARGKAPARSGEYTRLVQRFDTEPEFAQLVRKVAQGFELTVLEVHPKPGLVLGTTPETDFAVSVSELVPQTTDRPLYLLAQLTIAALAFPRPEDLDDDEYVGRISVKQVDEEVRALASAIERRLALTDSDVDPPTGQPGLEGLWRAYLRRNATGQTRAGGPPRPPPEPWYAGPSPIWPTTVSCTRRATNTPERTTPTSSTGCRSATRPPATCCRNWRPWASPSCPPAIRASRAGRPQAAPLHRPMPLR